MKQLHNRQQGFTIIELMIATAVMGVMLLMVTAIMVGISNLYYKGVSQARVQDNVRSITNNVAQQLQINGFQACTGNAAQCAAAKVYCIGDTRYTYLLGRKLGTDASVNPAVTTPKVLWQDDNTGHTGCVPDWTNSKGTELLVEGARITKFDIQAVGTSSYRVYLSEAYGDNDLFNIVGGKYVCKGESGTAYCATAFLEVTASKRLTP